MKNILITGARSYVAWSLIKLAKKQQDIRIFLGDSDKKALSFKSNYYDEKIIFPSVKNEFQSFSNFILNFVKQNNIKIIYPTCEEVFYFSKIKEKLENLGCELFADNFEKLDILHSKYNFGKYIQKNKLKFNINIPEIKIINKIKDFKKYISDNKDFKKYIFKYNYSRFADNIFVNFDSKNFKNIRKYQNKINLGKNKLLAQEFITGEGICSFGIAKNGKLVSNIVYKNLLKYNSGAGTFIENIFHKKINNFVENLVRDLNFTGFISFDFIENKNDLFVIECNPRVTSGIHFFDDNTNYSDIIFKNNKYNTFFKNKKIYKTFLLTNLFFNFNKILKYKQAFSFSNEVLKSEKKVFLYQIYLIFYYKTLSIRTGKSLTEITTGDIEFNGE